MDQKMKSTMGDRLIEDKLECISKWEQRKRGRPPAEKGQQKKSNNSRKPFSLAY